MLKKGICEEVACDFERNRVSGQAFMELREEDLKELVPMIGVRTEIRRILKECREVSGYSNITTVILRWCTCVGGGGKGYDS